LISSCKSAAQDSQGGQPLVLSILLFGERRLNRQLPVPTVGVFCRDNAEFRFRAVERFVRNALRLGGFDNIGRLDFVTVGKKNFDNPPRLCELTFIPPLD